MDDLELGFYYEVNCNDVSFRYIFLSEKGKVVSKIITKSMIEKALEEKYNLKKVMDNGEEQ